MSSIPSFIIACCLAISISSIRLAQHAYAAEENPIRDELMEYRYDLAARYANTSVSCSHLRDHLYSPENMKYTNKYLHRTNFTNVSSLVANNLRQILISRVQTLLYQDLLIHRYDSPEDMRLSMGPDVNQEVCIEQLSLLTDRIHQLRREMSNSQDVGIQRYVDMFGRWSSGFLSGRSLLTGPYSDCITLKINDQSMRYCHAHLKHPNWNQTDPLSEFVFIKTGVCLPKSCDATDYKNKLKLIEDMLYLVEPEFKAYDLQLDNLYCIPDEDSPIRQWWRFESTNLVLICLAMWLSLIVYATFRYEAEQSNDAREIHEGDKISAALALTRNFRGLIRTDKDPTLSEDHLKIDLNFLDGIKVMSTIYIFLGHTSMWTTSLSWNGSEQTRTISFGYYAPYLAPAFSVNSFFVVTGLLTTYMVFKASESHSFITSPLKWLGLIIFRYLRVMPTYLAFTLFAKHIARFLGSGPFWDYATSSLATRRACENESILWTLLLGANFKAPYDHCLAPGWSLANDYQFFLTMPIFVPMLYLYPKIAKTVIKLCIAIGALASFHYIVQLDIDFRPIINFDCLGFKYQMAYLVDTYSFPQYRIPSYLLGILFGYTVYTYKCNQAKLLDEETKKRASSSTKDIIVMSKSEGEWSRSFISYGPLVSFALIIICSTLPLILSRITFSPSLARVFYAMLMPLGHLAFAWAVGSYIILAATGFGNGLMNQFLSLPFWRPLSRLSLCVLLANLEVIQYFTQVQTELQAFGTGMILAYFVLSGIVTYLVGALVYLIIEAPIRNLMSLAVSRSVSLREITKEKKAQ